MAGDDVRIVERMDEREAALVAQGLHALEGLADVGPVQHDLGAVAQARLDLRTDRARGHHDDAMNARLRRRPRVRLGGVAGRQGDDAGVPLRRGQRRHAGQRAARLERAGLLEVLRLEIEAAVGDLDAGAPMTLRRGRRAQQRRAMDPAVEQAPGGPDLGERNDVVGHAGSMSSVRPCTGRCKQWHALR